VVCRLSQQGISNRRSRRASTAVTTATTSASASFACHHLLHVIGRAAGTLSTYRTSMHLLL